MVTVFSHTDGQQSLSGNSLNDCLTVTMDSDELAWCQGAQTLLALVTKGI